MPAKDPIATFTRQHPTTGDRQERQAYTPSEEVALTADGWVKKPAKSNSTASSGSTSAGGKQSANS